MGMLSLGRRIGERVALDVRGVRIWVILLDVGPGNRARIGFDAPGEVKIAREELLKAAAAGEKP